MTLTEEHGECPEILKAIAKGKAAELEALLRVVRAGESLLDGYRAIEKENYLEYVERLESEYAEALKEVEDLL